MSWLYREAGKILDALLATPAQVLTNLTVKRVLDKVIDETGLFVKNEWLKTQGYGVYVMLYDLLLGFCGELKGGGRMKKVLLENSLQLRSTFVRMKVKAKIQNNYDFLPPVLRSPWAIPRYARINKLKIMKVQVIKQLLKEGYKQVDELKKETNQDKQGEVIQQLESEGYKKVDELKKETNQAKVFAVDQDLGKDYLLVFPPSTDLHDHPLVLSGALILQDKASIMSGYILGAKGDSDAIDSCAAPGMKTTQIATSMMNNGRLFAFDKDPKRLETLVKLTTRNGVKNLTAQCADFLGVDPKDKTYANVKYILCDPSCSGSGIVGRLDDLVAYATGATHRENTEDEQTADFGLEDRLTSLSDFQLAVILHAAKFPKVDRIVYSTCSIYQKENEEVVIKALEQLGDKFELEEALPQWPRRGRYIPEPDESGDEKMPSEEILDKLHYCVRTDPKIDKTIGFFVASFIRKSSDIHQKIQEREAKEALKKKKKVVEREEKEETEVREGSEMEETTEESIEKEEAEDKEVEEKGNAKKRGPEAILEERSAKRQKTEPKEEDEDEDEEGITSFSFFGNQKKTIFDDFLDNEIAMQLSNLERDKQKKAEREQIEIRQKLAKEKRKVKLQAEEEARKERIEAMSDEQKAHREVILRKRQERNEKKKAKKHAESEQTINQEGKPDGEQTLNQEGKPKKEQNWQQKKQAKKNKKKREAQKQARIESKQKKQKPSVNKVKATRMATRQTEAGSEEDSN